MAARDATRFCADGLEVNVSGLIYICSLALTTSICLALMKACKKAWYGLWQAIYRNSLHVDDPVHIKNKARERSTGLNCLDPAILGVSGEKFGEHCTLWLVDDISKG